MKVVTYLKNSIKRRRSARLWPDDEEHATRYWATLSDYHLTNDEDPIAVKRSEWLVRDVLEPLAIRSLQEVGCNSGRNLAIAKHLLPQLEVTGFDVNPLAVEHARTLHPDLGIHLADANEWPAAANSVDAILTMSVLDHIPRPAVETVAKNMALTAAHYVVCVELFDGGDGKRDLYKYSYDLAELFGKFGVKPVRWEPAEGQYDTASSPLYLFVGDCSDVQSD
jgi:SAM-dependent methyltransferase